MAASVVTWAYDRPNKEARQEVIVVRARKGQSGRLKRCIPIGEYRDRVYRVRRDILKAWGGLTVKDGYIQRSGRLPSFLCPEMFVRWFERQDVELMSANNQGDA